ncbi:MAG: hypothetical protein IJR58_08020 [Lachnospiraceae bacterium]|nr:hypothetical protein [Lachnospiraceae bacterium]
MFKVNPNGLYVIRVIAGGYLIYMSYQMARDNLAGNAPNPVLSWVFTVLFFLVGVFFIVYELRRAKKEREETEQDEIQQTPVKTDEELLHRFSAESKEEEEHET